MCASPLRYQHGAFLNTLDAPFEVRLPFDRMHRHNLCQPAPEAAIVQLAAQRPVESRRRHFEGVGSIVTPDQLALYYATLRREIAAYGFPVETFETHQSDPAFFGDSMGHPSAKGWMTFNRVMSAFYHDKLPAEGEPGKK